MSSGRKIDTGIDLVLEGKVYLREDGVDTELEPELVLRALALVINNSLRDALEAEPASDPL